MTQPVHLRIDFVSDIACPWCAVGLAGLRQALARLDGTLIADIHLQPFELDPEMPHEGANAADRLKRKYGMDDAQLEANRRTIRERAAAVGVDIRHDADTRSWNTFDAHRLLHWAGQIDHDKALALKERLFQAYFSDNENVAEHGVLVRLADEIGLDGAAARGMLAGSDGAEEVRALEQDWQRAGVHSVPATIVNGKYLISGGQPPEQFERILHDIANDTAKTATASSS